MIWKQTVLDRMIEGPHTSECQAGELDSLSLHFPSCVGRKLCCKSEAREWQVIGYVAKLVEMMRVRRSNSCLFAHITTSDVHQPTYGRLPHSFRFATRRILTYHRIGTIACIAGILGSRS